MSVRTRLAPALICLMVFACGEAQGPVLTRLYFGLSSPQGAIADSVFSAFVDSAITPRFPDGLTVFMAQGQWRQGDGATQREESRVVEIVHERSARADSSVERIVESYKRAFSQQSVLVVRQRPELVRF